MRELPAIFFGVIIGKLILPRFLKIDQKVFMVENYRNENVLTSTGIWLALTLVLATIPFVFWYKEMPILWFYVMSISFIGLIDDLLHEKAKGLKGHFLKLRNGVITSGVIKLVFIFILSMGLAFVFRRPNLYVDAALTALVSNTLNTLDTRPKRAVNFYLIALFILVLSRETDLFRLLALALSGILFVLIPYETQEKTMLGDAGSNLLGAVLGLCLWKSSITVKIALIFFGVLWQVFADRYSFSKLLDNIRKEK
ncbi:MAG: hypothetical protein PHD88_09235 [Firmicutes bacterium]|nr:hypothetical protein [Bacillota bacterium]